MAVAPRLSPDQLRRKSVNATPLCPLDQLPDNTARGFELRGQAIFVVRKNGKLYGYLNRCPHLGVQLQWLPDQFLDRDAELIQCSTHGALFLIEDGQCVAGPCSGQQLQPLSIEVRDATIYLIESRSN